MLTLFENEHSDIIIFNMYTHGWFMSMYGKNDYSIVISLQLK